MPKVVVQAYDPEWPRAFQRIHDLVWPAVQHAAIRLEHVGSTAVPGLRAKPTIDACIVVASSRDLPYVITALAKVGYTHRGDLGVPGREAFKPPAGLPKHHLYASPRQSLSLRNQLSVRDYLRTHPDAVREYGDLKQALAERFPEDIDSYIAGKTDFIVGIFRQVGFADAELESIRDLNRLEPLTRPEQPRSV